MAKKHEKTFGEALREARMKQKISLRKFAHEVGVSPTYQSQVEQNKALPPTADRVKRMAEVLGENPDEWIALAGRVAEELPDIINEVPSETPDLLRAVRGMTAADIRTLREKAEQLKKKRRS